jgi:hypothetical protein
MHMKTRRLWITVVILGWGFDFLFWKQAPGVNFAIYATLVLLAGFWLLQSQGLRPARNSLWLLPPIAYLAVLSFIRLEPLTALLSYGLTLFLMGLLTLTFLGGGWPRYRLVDYSVGFLRLAGSMLLRPLTYASEVRRQQAESEVQRAPSRVWPILRGVLISIPVLALFAALLSSADLVFAQRVGDFVALFKLEKLPEYIFRAVYILIGAYLLAGAYLHAAQRSRDEELPYGDKPLLVPFLGFTEASIVLGSLLLLFATFVVIQFQYFFGGQANISLAGYTYSEYARRGFGELVAVAFFSLLLLLGLGTITHRDRPGQRTVFSGLSLTLVALVIVILVSAFQRLVLYESAYGFSRLRTYTHVFMPWLGLVLVTVALLEILGRRRAFTLVVLLASLGFAVSLSLLNVDAFIVRQNLQRVAQGQELDVTYLASLSDDAVPALVQAYRSASLPSRTREGVGATLACYAARTEPHDSTRSWKSFHFSRSNADRALQTLNSELQSYRVHEGGGQPYTVTAPGGEIYPCGGSSTLD